MRAQRSNLDQIASSPPAPRNDREAGRVPVLDTGAYLAGPNHDSLVAPAPTCTGPDNPPRYEPTTYGDFTRRLLTLNFAHRRGEEPVPSAG